MGGGQLGRSEERERGGREGRERERRGQTPY